MRAAQTTYRCHNSQHKSTYAQARILRPHNDTLVIAIGRADGGGSRGAPVHTRRVRDSARSAALKKSVQLSRCNREKPMTDQSQQWGTGGQPIPVCMCAKRHATRRGIRSYLSVFQSDCLCRFSFHFSIAARPMAGPFPIHCRTYCHGCPSICKCERS